MNPQLTAQVLGQHQHHLTEIAARDRRWYRVARRRRLLSLRRRSAPAKATFVPCCV
jgi:hypothetical protein